MKGAFSTTVAIIGGGASGALVAMQIARQSRIPCQVILYEPKAAGNGLAYGTTCISHLMNVPAARLSADPDSPNDFLHWLEDPQNCPELEQPVPPGSFVPRTIYGRYLNWSMHAAFANSRCQARLIVRTAKAVDFLLSPVGGTVVSADADTDDVRHVVLALGNLPPRDPLPGSHPFFRSDLYLSNIWSPNTLDSVAATENVIIVGTGLTAIDAVLALEDRGHTGHITLTSRGGRLPQPHAPATPYFDFLKDRKIPASAISYWREILCEIRNAQKIGSDWRSVIDAIRPHTQRLWLNLPFIEKKRFLRHIRPLWESHRHRCPPTSWQRICALQNKEQLTLLPGRIRSIDEDNSGRACVTILPKGRQPETTLRVDHVLNCIGPESNFRQHFNDRLIVNLIARGTIHPDPLYLGINATPDGLAINFEEQVNPRISIIGPPLRGILWETTAMPEVRVQAKSIAARITEILSLQDWSI